MDELRLILLGIGLVVLVLIYLWGMRKQIRERIEERRRRAQARVPENEPQLASEDPAQDSEVDVWSEPEIRVIRPATAARQSTDAEPDPSGSTDAEPSAARPSASKSDASRPSVSRPSASKSDASRPAPFKPVQPGSAPSGSAPSEPAPTDAPDAAEPTPGQPDAPAASAKPDAGRNAPVARSSESRTQRRRAANDMTVLMTVMPPSGQQIRGGAIRVACEASDLVLGEGGVWECRSEATEDQAMIFGIAHLREPGTFSADTLNTLETPGLLLFMQLPGPLDPVPAVDLMISVAGRLARRLGATVCDRKHNRMSTQAMIRLRADAAEFERRMQEPDEE